VPFITIDPYYDTQFYNQAKESLKNNGVQFDEYINIKAPYDWYLDIDQKPIMVDYDEATSSEMRWMVSAVKPLRANDAYLLMRRDNDNGPKALLKFVENEPLRKARLADYACFFTVKNREEAEDISRDYPGTIWYLGKYYNNRFRVCLAVNSMIKNLINKEQILIEKTKELSEPGRLEAELNFKVFREKDRLIKYMETPTFEKGIFKPVKIIGDKSNKFKI
jgi:hypothetical protein